MRAEANLVPGLYLVSTPIGAARDITLRALDILRDADVIAAEDTRTARRLMEIHGVALGQRPLWAYHDHNGPSVRPKIMEALAANKSIAYMSEAGTPMVADPGYQLVAQARSEGHSVFAAPGASAVLAALCVSGMPTDRFLFAGFAPNAKGARERFLRSLKDVDATLVLYESPKRVRGILESCELVFGGERRIALCRELTKKFEEVTTGTIAELLMGVDDMTLKGEFVVIVDRAQKTEFADADILEALRDEMKVMSRKDAIATVAQELDLPRKQVYALALKMD